MYYMSYSAKCQELFTLELYYALLFLHRIAFRLGAQDGGMQTNAWIGTAFLIRAEKQLVFHAAESIGDGDNARFVALLLRRGERQKAERQQPRGGKALRKLLGREQFRADDILQGNGKLLFDNMVLDPVRIDKQHAA